jgi:hypothetical protein
MILRDKDRQGAGEKIREWHRLLLDGKVLKATLSPTLAPVKDTDPQPPGLTVYAFYAQGRRDPFIVVDKEDRIGDIYGPCESFNTAKYGILEWEVYEKPPKFLSMGEIARRANISRVFRYRGDQQWTTALSSAWDPAYVEWAPLHPDGSVGPWHPCERLYTEDSNDR